jgi:deazaflavin-dependent oxidoreductase (nitroreductase family)
MSAPLIILIVVLVLACAVGCRLVRHGVRGRRSSRLLGRTLHMGTRTPRVSTTWSRLHASVYSRTRGRVLQRWFGIPVLVIETTGRRTGKRRATAITYVPLKRGWLMMPINAGSSRTPAWWLNLSETRSGRVIVGGETHVVDARVVSGEERERLWRTYTARAPVMEEYRSLTERDVPVVVLEPRG